VAKHRRIEFEVSEPGDARRLSLAVLGDHLRAALNPSLTSAPGRVAREQHAAGPVQEERSMARSVTGVWNAVNPGTDMGPSAVSVSSTGTGSGAGITAPTTRMKRLLGRGLAPEMRDASPA
jgi:hypothetical protein